MKVWPQFSEKMIDSVKEILESGQVNQWTNPIVREFEEKFATYFGTKYAVAVFNGTAALELCPQSAQIKRR